MKKFISLILSLTMLFTLTAGIELSAQASGWIDNSLEVEYDTTYTAEPSTLDAGEHKSDMGVTIDRYFDAFKFTVPVKGTVTLNMNAQSKNYLPKTYESRIDYLIYSDNNVDEELDVSYITINSGFSSARNMYYGEYEWTLSAGTYYLLFEYDYNSFWGFYQEGSCEFSLTYKPTLGTPSISKASARNKTSLKMSWSKVGGATGYQIQYATNKKFTKNKKTVTIKKASTTSKTIKKLKSKKTYYVRVRTYKTVNGKKYYSSWSTVKKVTTK